MTFRMDNLDAQTRRIFKESDYQINLRDGRTNFIIERYQVVIKLKYEIKPPFDMLRGMDARTRNVVVAADICAISH